MSGQVNQDSSASEVNDNIKESTQNEQQQNQNQEQNMYQESKQQYNEDFIQEKLDSFSGQGELNQNTVTLNTSTLEAQNQFIPQQNLNELSDNTNEVSSQQQASQMQQYILQMANQIPNTVMSNNQSSFNTPQNGNQQNNQSGQVSQRTNTDNSILCKQEEVQQQNQNEDDKIHHVLEIEKVKVYSSHEIQHTEIQNNSQKQIEEQSQQVEFLNEEQNIKQNKQQIPPNQLQQAQQQQQMVLQNKQYAGLITPSARASGNYMDEKSPSNTQNDNTSRSQFKQTNKEIYSENNNFEDTVQNYDNVNTDYYQITPIQINKKARQNQDAQVNQNVEKKNLYERYNDQEGKSQNMGKIQYIHSLAYYDPLASQQKIKKRGGQEEGNDVSLQDLLNQNQYSLASSVNFNYSISNYSSSKKQQRNKLNATSSNYDYSEKLQERVEDRLLKMGHKKEEKLQKLRYERDQQFLQMTKAKSPDKNLYRQKQINYQEFQSMNHQSLDQNQIFQSVGASLDSQFFQNLNQNISQDSVQNQKYNQQQQLGNLSSSQNFRETDNSNEFYQNQILSVQERHLNDSTIQNETYQRLQGKKQLKYQFKPNIYSASQTSLVVNKRDFIKQNYLQQKKQVFSLINTSQIQQQAQSTKNSNGNQLTYKQISSKLLSNTSSPRAALFSRQNIEDSIQSSYNLNQNTLNRFYNFNHKQQQQQMTEDKNKVISTLYDSAQRQRYEQQLKEQEELNIQQQQYYQSIQNLTSQQVRKGNEQINGNKSNQVQQQMPKEFSFNQSGLSYNTFQVQPSSEKMLFYSDKVYDLKLLQNYSPNFKSKYGAKYITQAGSNEYNAREYIRKIAQDCKQTSQFINEQDYYQQNQ